jgi:hypothetical protein
MKNLQRWSPRQDNGAWGICVEGTLANPVWIIHPQKDLDDQDAQLISATHNAAVEERPERSIIVSSLVNTSHEPIVQIAVGPEVAQLGVRDARQHVTQLQEAIEGAMSDALLCRFIGDYVYRNKSDEEAKHAIGAMLVMFRDFRASMDEPVTVESEA